MAGLATQVALNEKGPGSLPGLSVSQLADAYSASACLKIADAYSASASAIEAGSGSIASSRCWASCSSRLAATRCRLRR